MSLDTLASLPHLITTCRPLPPLTATSLGRERERKRNNYMIGSTRSIHKVCGTLNTVVNRVDMVAYNLPDTGTQCRWAGPSPTHSAVGPWSATWPAFPWTDGHHLSTQQPRHWPTLLAISRVCGDIAYILNTRWGQNLQPSLYSYYSTTTASENP